MLLKKVNNMKTIYYTCENCNQQLSSYGSSAGYVVVCPSCQENVVIPKESTFTPQQEKTKVKRTEIDNEINSGTLDLNFKHFVLPLYVKIVWVLNIVCSILFSSGWVIRCIVKKIPADVAFETTFMVFLGCIAFLIVLRLTLEMMLITFKIYEELKNVRRALEKS